MHTTAIKDEISELSFSHDGKKILFDRCREDDCQIQVYDLATGELSAYQSPANERWTMAKYSYDGKKIVFAIIPTKGDYLELSDMQIAVMDPDGKNLKKITTGPGAKIYPVFSHSGTKVLYARAAYIRKRGATPAAQFDAWEADLTTGAQTQLTYFKYFIMNHLSYYPDDERFIFYGDRPEAYPGIKDGDTEALKTKWIELSKKGIGLHGTVVMKGKEMIPMIYSFAKDYAKNVFPQDPLLSKDGSQMFFGTRGGRYYLYSPDGDHRFVGEGGSVNSAAISPDGELLGMIAADVAITVFRVKDGSCLKKVYAPGVQKNVYFKDLLPTLKLLPEQPLRIINRGYGETPQ